MPGKRGDGKEEGWEGKGGSGPQDRSKAPTSESSRSTRRTAELFHFNEPGTKGVREGSGNIRVPASCLVTQSQAAGRVVTTLPASRHVHPWLCGPGVRLLDVDLAQKGEKGTATIVAQRDVCTVWGGDDGPPHGGGKRREEKGGDGPRRKGGKAGRVATTGCPTQKPECKDPS
ncbi:hypothetical protein EI94DRAFT_1708946 [Lactarius quietus]|nr:hypothetical protein EI94DRAFT_1708946 [Lactarius quietus]